jgi:uncharacterized protein YfaQ (DUF2300 family)
VEGEACLVVDYFSRYPIARVDRLPSGDAAPEGPLRGPHRVLFENGNVLTFTSSGELRLLGLGPKPRIEGRLDMTEYVARVLDREADPNAVEAARALAVVIRTWVAQNAPFERGCFQVEDSTRMQRVSPSPATPGARAAALFAEGLLLRGASVRYQRAEREAGVLTWVDAVAEAKGGASYDRILEASFPGSTLATESGEGECRRLPEVESWLASAVPRWRERLSREPGFEPPDRPLTVCALGSGNPYADRERLRVFVRGLGSADSRITLAHEYVHLSFPFHPAGFDEAYVERLARTLIGE